MLLHTVCLTLSVFLSTPGLCAGAPRQDKRNEKTQRSTEEKLLGAQKRQRQSSYLDYRSHNPLLSLESTYSPSRTPYPRIPFWPRVHYPNFVQYTQVERSLSNNLSSRSGQPDVPALKISMGLTGPIHHNTVWCSITALFVKPQLTTKLFCIAY